MGTISHVITPKLTLPHLTSKRSHGVFPYSNSRVHTLIPRKVSKLKSQSSTSACSTSAIDFSDPDWKTKFQKDFEARFRLPHITDVFPDDDPIPSTFCLKMRLIAYPGRKTFPAFEIGFIGTHCGILCSLLMNWRVLCNRTPITGDFPGNYPSDEEWHGYINNNDRVLLKVYFVHLWCFLTFRWLVRGSWPAVDTVMLFYCLCPIVFWSIFFFLFSFKTFNFMIIFEFFFSI